MHEVRCICCHRVERWNDGTVTVWTEGGTRRPAGAPVVAAWNTLKRSLQHEIGPVVGKCDACGQPLIGESGMTWFDWTLELTDEPVVVTAQGVSDEEALESALKAAYGWKLREVRPALAIFQTVLISVSSET